MGQRRSAKAVGLLEMDSVFLVVDRARPVFDHCLYFLVRDARYRPESISDFVVGILILDSILVGGVVSVCALPSLWPLCMCACCASHLLGRWRIWGW